MKEITARARKSQAGKRKHRQIVTRVSRKLKDRTILICYDILQEVKRRYKNKTY